MSKKKSTSASSASSANPKNKKIHPKKIEER
jgi:hypothetical protein